MGTPRFGYEDKAGSRTCPYDLSSISNLNAYLLTLLAPISPIVLQSSDKGLKPSGIKEWSMTTGQFWELTID